MAVVADVHQDLCKITRLPPPPPLTRQFTLRDGADDPDVLPVEQRMNNEFVPLPFRDLPFFEEGGKDAESP